MKMKTNILNVWLLTCLLPGVYLSLVAGEASAPRFNLTGAVRDPDGHVIKQATVIIYTAKRKDGSDWNCSPCYPDCSKHTVTDAQGIFKIESLDSSLYFCVFIAAPGFTPVLKDLVDATDGPLDIVLNPLVEARLKPGTYLKGRVLDARDKPMAGVKVELLTVDRASGKPGIVDPIALTDPDGRFFFTSIRTFDCMSLGVSAPGFAPKHWVQLSNTNEAVLKITVGATVTGRVLHRRKPAPHVTISFTSENRSYPAFLGDFKTETDDQGRFVFSNMPPYSVMQLLGTAGNPEILEKLYSRKVRVPGDGAIKDIGDWSTE